MYDTTAVRTRRIQCTKVIKNNDDCAKRHDVFYIFAPIGIIIKELP